MKYKIIISCIFFGCYTLSTCAKPTLSAPQVEKLNINLPLQQQEHRIKKMNIKPSDTTLILASARRSPRINFLVLSTTKNAVLKAVLKRKSYGLRYTMIW